MRLVNSEEVLQNAKECIFTFAEDKRRYMDFLEYCLNNAPTVEAKEVVHGKWVDTQPEYHCGYRRNAHVCSNCNYYYTTEYDDLFFCPRGGADMRTSAE